jgi:molecular chaperone GrpE
MRRADDTGAVGDARGSSVHRSGDAPAERARSPRAAGVDPQTGQPPRLHEPSLDPELSEDLGAEYEFRGDVLEGELESARQEAAAHLDTARRLQADFDNYRKRVARDSEDAARRAGQRVIAEMLPALDNLERALGHVEAGGEGVELVEGVMMVVQQVLDVFGKEGVERIDAVGASFDPNEHQAVGQVEKPDVPEGTVVEVYQHGYRMHGRVVRPATVVVSTGGPAPRE